ncbi:MAG: SH3 domain-containing protein [Candidatus Syntrophopropionicum ammoniitolerans]
MHSRYRFTGIFLIALALALFCGFSGANKAFADTAVVATDVLNVRAGPGANHNMVTQVGRSERFTVVDKSGDWYCVTLNSGQKGWLAGWLVNIEKSPAPTPTPPAAPGVNTTVKVNGSVVNIRSGRNRLRPGNPGLCRCHHAGTGQCQRLVQCAVAFRRFGLDCQLVG